MENKYESAPTKQNFDNSCTKDTIEQNIRLSKELSNDELLCFTYERVITEVTKALDIAISLGESSLSIFKKYIDNLYLMAKDYPYDVIMIMGNVKVISVKLNSDGIKPLLPLAASMAKKEQAIIENCIKDGYIKNCNWIVISLFIREILHEISMDYLINKNDIFSQKMDSDLWDMLLVNNEK